MSARGSHDEAAPEAVITAGTTFVEDHFVDHDGDMKLDFEEFVAMQPLPILEHHTREQIRQWYDEADVSGDGKLTTNEFFTWSLSRSSVSGTNILEAVFRKYDSDGGDSLCSSEFKCMANDLGFGHVAAEAFAVLDTDRGGTISFKELKQSLASKCPRNMETKKLLWSCIWSWGLDQNNKVDRRPRVDTSSWRIRTSDTASVYDELRELLRASGAHVQDLAMIFDEDVCSRVTIDQLEFVKVLKQWGFRGMPHVLDDVFDSINRSGSGKIDYDEFYEFVRGHRHALDSRARSVKVRELIINEVPGATLDEKGVLSPQLIDIRWECDPSAHDAVESLRILLLHALKTTGYGLSPSDLNIAWDRTGDRTLDKHEFVSNLRRLFRHHPQLWQRELHRVAVEAFTIIQADGSDVDSSVMDVIELETWLDAPIRRKPDALLPLKKRRWQIGLQLINAQKEKERKQKEKLLHRPGCDPGTRAAQALAAAREVARKKLDSARVTHDEHIKRYEVRAEPLSSLRAYMPKNPKWKNPSSGVSALAPMPPTSARAFYTPQSSAREADGKLAPSHSPGHSPHSPRSPRAPAQLSPRTQAMVEAMERSAVRTQLADHLPKDVSVADLQHALQGLQPSTASGRHPPSSSQLTAKLAHLPPAQLGALTAILSSHSR